jgi:hypothetical protein
MSHRLDEANQLAFVGGELGVVRRDGLAEQRNWPGALMQHRSEA